MNHVKSFFVKFKMGILLFLSILLAFMIEIGVFQWNALKNPTDQQELSIAEASITMLQTGEIWQELTEEEQNQIEIDRENARLLAEANKTDSIYRLDEDLKEENGRYFRRSVQTILQADLPDLFCGKMTLFIPDAVEKLNYTLEGFRKDIKT